MKKINIVFFLAIVICLALPSLGHAYSWSPYGGHSYALTNQAGGWTTVEAEAVTAGGHLVTINSAAEEAWLRSTFGTAYKWIGFTDKDVEGSWKWISGEAVTYTHWNSGEPNNIANEDYAVLNWNSSTGAWNDWGGGNSLYGIIEVVPLPGAAWLLGSGLLGLAGWRKCRKN